MAKLLAFFCLFSYIIVLSLCSVSAAIDDNQDQQVYVVYMGALPSSEVYTPMSDHMNILQGITGESSNEGRLLRSYKRSFNGFAARLTQSERERIANMEGVVSVFLNKNLQLQTTTSWDFMGLKKGKATNRNLAVESNTIIGVIDAGITPESESFSDKGFGPPPQKWKGVCSGGKNFTCNNKLIGARDYTSEGSRDTVGHGTHTASTIAGNAIQDASFYGLGNGTMRGGVPASRIVTYKVCTWLGCSSDSILAAFDDAIADGVDIISISVNMGYPSPFEEDPVAIGSFHAIAKGILTVNSAGNNGPEPKTLESVAPWILTVAASNTNRAFITKVVLGNGKTLVGKSVNTFGLNGTMYPLVYGKSAVNSSACSVESAEKCEEGCLQESLVKGKVVVCNSTDSFEALANGAVAGISLNRTPNVAFVTSFPLSALSQEDLNSLVSYIKSESSPVATVLRTEESFSQLAPVVAAFSSRGPNTIATDILKPDISAPGVEILAAFSPEVSPSSSVYDTRRVKYSVLSGTSMSCPHVTGVAAYIRTFHPQWSPSMVKSAIMTTAWPMNASETGFVSNEFAYGAGHVDPISATNPGLVYDLTKADYTAFLCGMKYNETMVKLISGEAATCTGENLPRNLNYPSMSAKLLGSKSSFIVSFKRTVTNVGAPNSIYKSKVVLNLGSKLNVKVFPSALVFKKVNEKQSFTAIVTGSTLDSKLLLSANLIWSDGTHNVRSPIVVYKSE
ncbi:PREDICTED: cucumisin-like isoform X1 [Brassica oleracea var. oleracea]|uniref:cucumisin-like isoform X1 n=2 Tax=Brassica oleracea var. oleracea TaxID=109376 RepID=UPI0006A70E06|nr:PREDICTED: cucumisin-like isoform X1 [Brassica oleracea var. oleracea]